MQSRFYNPACRACGNPIPVNTDITKNAAGQWVHFRCPPRVAAAPTTPAAKLTLDMLGVYVAKDDSIYRVRESRPEFKGGPTHAYADRFRHISGDRATLDAGTCKGEYEYVQGLSPRLANAIASGAVRKMTPDEALHFTIRYGMCPFGHHLRAAQSVYAGIGPVCAERLGIDQKALAAENRAKLAATIMPSAGQPEAPAEPAPASTPTLVHNCKSDPCRVCEPATPAAADTRDFEQRYAELFGDDDDEPDAPPTLQPETRDEQTAARQRWSDGLLPTNGFNVRPSRYPRRRRAAPASYTVSRWSRPSDDDLGHAAGLGADSDDYAF